MAAASPALPAECADHGERGVGSNWRVEDREGDTGQTPDRELPQQGSGTCREGGPGRTTGGRQTPFRTPPTSHFLRTTRGSERSSRSCRSYRPRLLPAGAASATCSATCPILA